MLCKHISSGRWELSLLARNWISQKIKQKDRRSVCHAWALQGGKAGSRNYISRFPWDTAAPCAGEEMAPSLPPLVLEEKNSQMVKLGKAWSAVTWSGHICSSSAPQVSHNIGNCSTSFRIHSCFHSRRDLWIRESPSGIPNKHWASEKNTHCYCPGTTDNTRSSLSGKFPHSQAQAAKFYSQSHQNKVRTTRVFDRVILNLYQYIWEQIWGPSLQHHRLAVWGLFDSASQEQKIHWQYSFIVFYWFMVWPRGSRPPSLASASAIITA